MNQLVRWFEDLQQREQIMVSIAAVFVIVATFYFAAWMPLQNNLEKARKSVNSKRELVGWMQQSAEEIKIAQRGGNATQQNSRPLMQIINSTGRQQGFSFARLQPKDDNEVQFNLDEVKFDDFVTWLGMLNTRYQVNVDRITINGVEKSGYIKVNITLVR